MESRSRRRTEADHQIVIVDGLHLRKEAVRVYMYPELYGICLQLIRLLERAYENGLRRGLVAQSSPDGGPEDVDADVSDGANDSQFVEGRPDHSPEY